MRHENGSFSGSLTIKAIKKDVLVSCCKTPKLPLEPSHLVIFENIQIGCVWPRLRRTGKESFYVMIDDPSLARPMVRILRQVSTNEKFVLLSDGPAKNSPQEKSIRKRRRVA